MPDHITLNTLAQLKQQGQKFTCLTAYDATFAHMLSTAGVEVLLVGDTLGNVIQGHTTTIPVTLEDVAYHTTCVSRGNQGALLIADLPFMSYATPKQALKSAARLYQAGAEMVKLEGGEWLLPTVRALHERGIAVCGHLGLTPQSFHTMGGYKVQGRTPDQAEKILEDACQLEAAGASIIVLECVPSNLAKTITSQLKIPTIGIGAGPDCDGQVLVLYDMLGLTPGKPFKFTENFLGVSTLQNAVTDYVNAVKNKTFPTSKHAFN